VYALFSAAQAGEKRLISCSVWSIKKHGSGQLVNATKSAIFFSDNCQDCEKEDVKRITGGSNEALGENYLGLPTTVGRSTNGVF
jgi:hypothetical protein